MLGDRPSVNAHFFAYNYWLKFLSPIAVKLDGSKSPCFAGWDRYCRVRPEDYELSNWFGRDDVGIGIACGIASGNLAVLDFEDIPAFQQWEQAIPAESREQLAGCPCVETPGGGAHVWVRLPEPVSGTVLARYADRGVKIEIRGHGHMVIAPGSDLAVHVEKKYYRWMSDRHGWLNPTSAPPVTWESWFEWCRAAEDLTEYTPPPAPQSAKPSGPPTDDQPGTDFNLRGSWAETGLFDQGWTWFRQYDSERGLLCRPGKTGGCSATVGIVQSSKNDWPLFHCFSTSALPFDANTSETRFGVFAKLKHRSDFSAAAADLKRMGYGRKDAKVTFTAAGATIAEELNEADDDPHRLARAVLSTYRHEGRGTLAFWRGEFHEWDGCHYRTLPDADFTATVNKRVWEELKAVHQVRRQQHDPAGGEKPPRVAKVTRNLVASVIGAMEGLCQLGGVEEAPAWLQRSGPDPRDLVATAGGLVHLRDYAEGRKHALIGNTPHYFNFNAVGYAAEMLAPEPSGWLRFLSSVWPDDPQSIDLLQEWAGYLLTPDTRQQKMLLLIGPTRAGKGTITTILRALVGANNCAGMTLGTLAGPFGLSTLVGKTVALLPDARLTGRVPDAATIAERLLTISGEGEITVDRKHRDQINTRLPVRFVVATNEMPDLVDSSGALAKRWCVLRLTQTFFGREDHGLADRLLAELPGIFNWTVMGWKRLRQQGHFTVSASAADLIEAMKETGSPIGQFVEERCVVDPAGHVPKDALYAEWQRWCLSEGRKDTGDVAVFARQLRSFVPSVKGTRPRTGEGRMNIFQGIRLRTRSDDLKDFAGEEDSHFSSRGSDDAEWADRAAG